MPSAVPGRSHTTKLINLALHAGADLFTSPEGDLYISVPVGEHRETFPLADRSFKGWLARMYFMAMKQGVTGGALADAVTALSGSAMANGVVRAVFTRVAAVEQCVFVDLGRSDHRVLVIEASGWRVANAPDNVRFIRRRGMLGLPDPARGGSLSKLLPSILNVDGHNLMLVIGWVIQALRGIKPYPILAVHGEYGASKTYLCRLMRRIIDPSVAELSLTPKEPRDLMVTAQNNHVVGFDNLSYIPDWLSDALCCISTGAGFRVRANYTDAQEMIFSAARPVVMNGIAEVVRRGDLMDCCLVVAVEAISEEKRRTESDVDATFAASHPMLLAALADAVAQALRAPVSLDRLPRMADFAITIESAAPSLGWQRGEFLKVYTANRDDASGTILDGEPIALALDKLRALQQSPHSTTHSWSGTSDELLQALKVVSVVPDEVVSNLPKSAKALYASLRRLAPMLRKQGVGVELPKGRKGLAIGEGSASSRSCLRQRLMHPKGQERAGDRRGQRVITIVFTPAADASERAVQQPLTLVRG